MPFTGENYTATTEIKFDADAKLLEEKLRVLKKEATSLASNFEKVKSVFNDIGKTDATNIAEKEIERLDKALVKTLETLHSNAKSTADLKNNYKELSTTIANTTSIYSSLLKETKNLGLDKQEKQVLQLQDAYDKLKFSVKKALEQKSRWTSSENIANAQKELAKLTEEENKVNKLYEAYEKLKKEKLEAIAGGDISKVKELDVELSKQAKAIEEQTQNLRKYKRSVRDVTTAMSEMHRGKWVLEVGKRALAYASIYGGIYGIISAAKQATQTLSMLDTQLKTMEAVLDVSSVSAKALQTQLIQMSQTFGVNIEQIQQVAIELGRAGVEYKNLASATKVVTAMALMTGDSLEVAAGALITFKTNYEGLIKSMYKGLDPIQVLGNKLMYIANASKLSTQDIATLSNYAVASAKAIGLTVDAVGALSIALSNAGNNASTIGTSIRRLQKIIYGTGTDSVRLFQQLGMSQQWLTEQLRKSLNGTVEGARASNNALKLFITNLMNLSDQQFNNLISNMDILTKQTLIQIRNTGSVTKRQIDILMGKTKGQLSQALVIANSFANSWTRIKNKVVEFVNYAKPALQGVMNILNKVVNLLSSGDTAKMNELSNRILDLKNRMKALQEIGKGGSPLFKIYKKQIKELEAELTKLKHKQDNVFGAKTFYKDLLVGLNANDSLKHPAQAIFNTQRTAGVIEGKSLSEMLAMRDRIANGNATTADVANYVNYMREALKLEVKQKTISAQGAEVVKEYLQALMQYYNLTITKQGKIVKSTEKQNKNLKTTLDKVSILDTTTLSYYKKLGNIQVTLGNINDATRVSVTLFNKLKTEAGHFSNYLNSIHTNEFKNDNQLTQLVTLTKQLQNAKTNKEFNNLLLQIQAIYNEAGALHKKWLDPAFINHLQVLVDGEKTLADLNASILSSKNKQNKATIKAIDNSKALYQQIHSLYVATLTKEQQLVEWKKQELQKANQIKDAMLRHKAIYELNLVYENKKIALLNQENKIYDEQYKKAEAVYKKLISGTQTPIQQLNIQEQQDRLAILHGFSGKKQQDALLKLDIYYSKKKNEVYKQQLQKQQDEYKKWLDKNYKMYEDMLQNLQGVIQADLFDFMTGKFKNLGDFVKHLFKDVGRSIGQSMAKSLSQEITKKLTDNLKKQVLPSLQQFLAQKQTKVSPTAKTLNAASPNINYGNKGSSGFNIGTKLNSAMMGAGAGYIGGNIGDTIFGTKTRASTYGAIGGAIGAFTPLGPWGGAAIGAAIGGFFAKRVLKYTGYAFAVTMNEFNTTYLETLKHYDKKSWYSHKSWDKLSEASIFIKNQVKSMFLAYDKLLRDFGKINEYVSVQAGKYKKTKFNEKVLFNFFSHLMSLPKTVEVQLTKLVMAYKKVGDSTFYNGVKSVVENKTIDNPKIKAVIQAWKDYAKAVKKNLTEAAMDAFSKFDTSMKEMNIWIAKRLHGNTAALDLQYKYAQEELKDIQKAIGGEVAHMTVNTLIAKFNSLYHNMLKSSPTPTMLKEWEALAAALKNTAELGDKVKQKLNSVPDEASSYHPPAQQTQPSNQPISLGDNVYLSTENGTSSYHPPVQNTKDAENAYNDYVKKLDDFINSSSKSTKATLADIKKAVKDIESENSLSPYSLDYLNSHFAELVRQREKAVDDFNNVFYGGTVDLFTVAQQQGLTLEQASKKYKGALEILNKYNGNTADYLKPFAELADELKKYRDLQKGINDEQERNNKQLKDQLKFLQQAGDKANQITKSIEDYAKALDIAPTLPAFNAKLQQLKQSTALLTDAQKDNISNLADLFAQKQNEAKETYNKLKEQLEQVKSILAPQVKSITELIDKADINNYQNILQEINKRQQADIENIKKIFNLKKENYQKELDSLNDIQEALSGLKDTADSILGDALQNTVYAPTMYQRYYAKVQNDLANGINPTNDINKLEQYAGLYKTYLQNTSKSQKDYLYQTTKMANQLKQLADKDTVKNKIDEVQLAIKQTDIDLQSAISRINGEYAQYTNALKLAVVDKLQAQIDQAATNYAKYLGDNSPIVQKLNELKTAISNIKINAQQQQQHNNVSYATPDTSNPTNSYINSVYENVLGREADASGASYWANQISSGAISAADLPTAVANAASQFDVSSYGGDVPTSVLESSISNANNYLHKFADGGIVTKPVTGLIGEAGYPEAVIPLKNPNDPMHSKELIEEIRALRAEVYELKEINRSYQKQIAENTKPLKENERYVV